SEFAITPKELTVPAGVPVTFELVNEGTVPHDFAIEEVASSELVAGGARGTLTVDGLDEGTYTIVCHEAGHEAAGMVGTLVVSSDGAGPVEGEASAHEGHADDQPMTAQEMAAKHDDLSAFPHETERGHQPLEPEIEADGTKVFRLTASEISW